MQKIFIFPLLLLCFASCKTASYNSDKSSSLNYKSLTIDTLFQDEISIRAIELDNNKIWYTANKGRFGFFNMDSNFKKEIILSKDSLKLEFRSIAQTMDNLYIVNVGSPAVLYKISKNELDPKLVYQENNDKVFFDSMKFWDHDNGIAMGDPISNCLNIIITKDGGNSWHKIPCEKLPKTEEGEAAFAASNTNIIIKGNSTWIVSGGKKSRVFHSPDRALNWKVYETPIVQGKAMTGIFTADFYNEKLGFVAGGNYDVQGQNFANKAVTTNGGKTWKLIAENLGFGYASCVQYVPESKGNSLVVVGTSGVYYSANAGKTWKLLSEDTSFYTLRFIDENTAIAAGKNKMVRLNFK